MSMWNSNDPWRNPHRLYRDVENGRVAGVCAGIADYFGIRRFHVRLATILGLIFFFPATAITYVALTVLLPRKPHALYASEEEEVFWRGVTTAPADTLKALRHKFAELEQRLGGMETTVTSAEFDLHRKFRDIGG
jgi:phage shock protein C